METQVEMLRFLNTTKRRITMNLKTKNNQNCQKIKLYGSLTTKKLKKKHSSRLVGGVETGSWVERTQGKTGRWDFPHSHADEPGRTTWEQDRLCDSGFQSMEIEPQNLWL